MAAVTESLVDANDEARQAESRAALAEAINRFDRRTISVTFWIIGWMTALVLGALTIVIAVLG